MTQPSSPLNPELTLKAAAQQALASSLQQTRRYLRSLDTHVPDDLEVVHQLRVTTRRGGAAFDLFESACRSKDRRRWAKRLKRVRQAAGRARDLDVLIEQQKARKHPDQRLIKALQARRQTAQLPLLKLGRKWGKATKWRDQQLRFENRLLSQALGDSKSPAWSCSATQSLLVCLKRFEKLGRRTTRSLEDLHAFRIQAKRLRYTLEWLSPILPADTACQVLQDLKRIQDHLGSINDHSVALQLLESTVAGGKRQQTLIRREKKRLASSLTDWSQWWSTDRQQEFGEEIRHMFDPTD